MTRKKQRIWPRVKVAFSGIYEFLQQDQNAKIHIVIAILTCICGFYFELTKIEWLLVTICIGMVIASEMINAAVEKLCDLVQPEFDLRVKSIKDISAGAVLIVSMAAAILGLTIFIPKVITWF